MQCVLGMRMMAGMPNPDGESAEDHPKDDLDPEDFEPAPLHVAPDGGLAPEVPESPPLRPPPRICEAGPCVHYHCFTEQLDVEQPKGASVEPGGRVTGTAPAEFRKQTHHYCYPDVGIEFPLGGLPVFECNRWEPQDPIAVTRLVSAREKFRASSAGKWYEADVAAWKADLEQHRAKENEEDPATAWVTMNVRDGDEIEVWSSLTGDDWKHAATLNAEEARRPKSITVYLGTIIGPGIYELKVRRPGKDAAGYVATHTLSTSESR